MIPFYKSSSNMRLPLNRVPSALIPRRALILPWAHLHALAARARAEAAVHLEMVDLRLGGINNISISSAQLEAWVRLMMMILEGLYYRAELVPLSDLQSGVAPGPNAE